MGGGVLFVRYVTTTMHHVILSLWLASSMLIYLSWFLSWFLWAVSVLMVKFLADCAEFLEFFINQHRLYFISVTELYSGLEDEGLEAIDVCSESRLRRSYFPTFESPDILCNAP